MQTQDTLAKLAEDFYRDNMNRNLSERSIENYKYLTKVFLDFLTSKEIFTYKQITAETISLYIFNMRCQKQAPTSINTHLRYIRRFMNYISEHRNYKAIKIKLLKEPELNKTTFDKNEQIKIFKHANYCLTPSVACCLLLGTGVRSRTLINIKVEDIDSQSHLLTCTHTKNGKILVLPLTDFLQQLLKSYIEYHNLIPSDYLIFNKFRQKYTRNGIYAMINKYLKFLKINKTGVHIFRHTFAKGLVLNHCDTLTLMRWLGHSKMEEARTYVKLFSTDLQLSLSEYNPASNINIQRLKEVN